MTTITASILRDIITGTLTCTSTDATLPLLGCGCIKISITGNRLSTQATDRYRAIFSEYALENASEDFTALIDRKEAKRILASIPKGKGSENTLVTMTVTDKQMTFEWVTGSIAVNTSEGQHPDIAKLIPNDDTQLGLPSGIMHLNGNYLATMGAIPNPRNAPWKVMFHGDSKPMTASRSSEGQPFWVFLLMSVRIN